LAILFADNLFLCDSNRERLERRLEIGREKIKAAGLKISRKKTEHLPAVGDQKNIEMKSVVVWLYKACLSVPNSSTWLLGTVVLGDKKMPTKLKVLIYKIAIRPTLLYYGNEIWPTTKISGRQNVIM